MGNRFSLCYRTIETDNEEEERYGTMTKDVVCETTPFEGQKPGTSGKATSITLIQRFEKEGQSVYAEALHRELCPG